jgi:hypothetical protein
MAAIKAQVRGKQTEARDQVLIATALTWGCFLNLDYFVAALALVVVRLGVADPRFEPPAALLLLAHLA